MFLSLASRRPVRHGALGGAGTTGALATVVSLASLAVFIVALTPLGAPGNEKLLKHSRQLQSDTPQLVSAGERRRKRISGFRLWRPETASNPLGGAPIGTQGELWLVLYSHGYPALVFFIGFFLAVLWQTRHVARARPACGCTPSRLSRYRKSRFTAGSRSNCRWSWLLPRSPTGFCWQPQEQRAHGEEARRSRAETSGSARYRATCCRQGPACPWRIIAAASTSTPRTVSITSQCGQQRSRSQDDEAGRPST